MIQITLAQRYEIATLHKLGKTQEYIARTIGVHKSSISREFNHNADFRSGEYRPKLAERKCIDRHQNKPKKILFTSDVVETIESLLVEDYSPEQVVGHCDKKGLNCVSTETIYLHIWKDKKNRDTLHQHLLRKGGSHKFSGD